MADIDITTTATIRPDILRQTLESFRTNLLKGSHNYRLILNIDPVGEPGKAADDVLEVARSFFPNLTYNVSQECSFTKAVLWCWNCVRADYVFNLEDDWKMKKELNIDHILQAIDEHPQYSCFHLNHLSPRKFKELAGKDNKPLTVPFTEQRVMSLSPTFFHPVFIAGIRDKMVSNKDPEKQVELGSEARQYSKQAKFSSYVESDYGRLVYDIGRKWTRKYGYVKWPKSTVGDIRWSHAAEL